MNNKIPEYMFKYNNFNSNFNHKKELEYWLNKFDIEKEEICIIGSVPLHLAGIRENDDVDFITTKEVDEKILSKIDEYPECKVFKQKIFFGENIHSHKMNNDRLDYFGLTNNDLINDDKYHMVVDGFKIYRLELMLSNKVTEARPKDLEDVKRIEKSGLMGGPDWDWNLVYALPFWEKPQDSLYMRLRTKLYTDGFLKATKHYFSSFLRRIHLERTLESMLVFMGKISYVGKIWSSKTNYKDYRVMLPIPIILSNYLHDDSFQGWDIVLECLLLGDNPEFVTVKNTQISIPSCAIIDRKGKVVEGKSLIAKHINNNEYWVEITNDYKLYKNELIASLRNIELSATQVEIVNNKFFDIIETTGMVFYAILWPSAHEIFDEIEDYVNNQVKIIEMKQYDVTDNFSDIVRNFYKSDDRAKTWMIEKKISGISSSNEGQKEMRVLKLWIPDPELRYCTDDEGVIYSKITRNLKTKCRKKFYKKINDYFYDNLIHFTENYNNNFETAKILRMLDENKRCINHVKTKQPALPLLANGDIIEFSGY
jgi:hypothetical protein